MIPKLILSFALSLSLIVILNISISQVNANNAQSSQQVGSSPKGRLASLTGPQRNLFRFFTGGITQLLWDDMKSVRDLKLNGLCEKSLLETVANIEKGTEWAFRSKLIVNHVVWSSLNSHNLHILQLSMHQVNRHQVYSMERWVVSAITINVWIRRQRKLCHDFSANTVWSIWYQMTKVSESWTSVTMSEPDFQSWASMNSTLAFVFHRLVELVMSKSCSITVRISFDQVHSFHLSFFQSLKDSKAILSNWMVISRVTQQLPIRYQLDFRTWPGHRSELWPLYLA